MINEGDKIKLKTGEIAIVSEIIEDSKAYIAEVFKAKGGVSVEQILYNEIASIFKEFEHSLT
jgi:hypothetical protein